MEPNLYEAPTEPIERQTRHAGIIGMPTALVAVAWILVSTALGGVTGFVIAYGMVASMSGPTFATYGAVVASNTLAIGLLGGLALGFVLAARTILVTLRH